MAHLAVIFKPSTLESWVSTSLWQLGELIHYDLKLMMDDSVSMYDKIVHLNKNKSKNIPADNFLQEESYNDLLLFRLLSKNEEARIKYGISKFISLTRTIMKPTELQVMIIQKLVTLGLRLPCTKWYYPKKLLHLLK
jgi:hypothetical protein